MLIAKLIIAATPSGERAASNTIPTRGRSRLCPHERLLPRLRRLHYALVQHELPYVATNAQLPCAVVSPSVRG